MPFFCIHILQGSVATCLKHGGIFKHEFVANLLPSRVVKNFENWKIVSEEFGVLFFLTHGVFMPVLTISLSNKEACHNQSALKISNRHNKENAMHRFRHIHHVSKTRHPIFSSITLSKMNRFQ